MNSDMNSPSLAPEKPCPLCGKPALEKFRPFCSRRCADIDLNRWLSGVYAVPVKEDESEDETDTVRAGMGDDDGR